MTDSQWRDMFERRDGASGGRSFGGAPRNLHH